VLGITLQHLQRGCCSSRCDTEAKWCMQVVTLSASKCNTVSSASPGPCSDL
jgi:hypothetical protein